MKVLLILPDARMHKFSVLGRVRSTREAPLTLTTLAALGSRVPGVEFRLVDESIDAVPLDAAADLVALGRKMAARGIQTFRLDKTQERQLMAGAFNDPEMAKTVAAQLAAEGIACKVAKP